MQCSAPRCSCVQEDKAARAELDLAVADLRKQLNVEQQAHTQTQKREETGNTRYQDTYMHLQMRMQELHDISLQVERLQQQLDTVERQRCASLLVQWSGVASVCCVAAFAACPHISCITVCCNARESISCTLALSVA